MQRIADGIELEDGPIHADAISYATDTDRNQAGIEIHSDAIASCAVSLKASAIT